MPPEDNAAFADRLKGLRTAGFHLAFVLRNLEDDQLYPSGMVGKVWTGLTLTKPGGGGNRRARRFGKWGRRDRAATHPIEVVSPMRLIVEQCIPDVDALTRLLTREEDRRFLRITMKALKILLIRHLEHNEKRLRVAMGDTMSVAPSIEAIEASDVDGRKVRKLEKFCRHHNHVMRLARDLCGRDVARAAAIFSLEKTVLTLEIGEFLVEETPAPLMDEGPSELAVPADALALAPSVIETRPPLDPHKHRNHLFVLALVAEGMGRGHKVTVDYIVKDAKRLANEDERAAPISGRGTIGAMLADLKDWKYVKYPEKRAGYLIVEPLPDEIGRRRTTPDEVRVDP